MESIKTGTTTLAVICKDGIVTAADKRATAGHLIVQMDVEKIIKIADHMVMTIAGSVSDIQLFAKYIKAELKLNSLRTNRMSTVHEAANMLSSIVYSGIRQYFPSVTHFLLSGKDEIGFHVYDIYPDGSINEIKTYGVSGSGSIFAMGLLDSTYQENMSIDETISLVKKALNSALTRDTASGNGADIYTITDDGIQKRETITVSTGIPQ